MEKIEQLHNQWIDSIQTGNLATISSLLTEDAVWLPPHQPAIVGRNAILDWLSPFFNQFEYDVTVIEVNFRVAGSWVVEKVRYRSKLADRYSGKILKHDSSHMILWRREVGDTWRIERYIDISE